MAKITYPGVYVEELPQGVHPIQAASTSVAAFIGKAEQGEINTAIKVSSFTEYQHSYGGFRSDSYLTHAVYQFFNNGGTQCYIVRVAENTVPSRTNQQSGTLAAHGAPHRKPMTYAEAFPLLDNLDDVGLIAVPGIGFPALVGEGLEYCADRHCFFIADMAPSDDSVDKAKAFMAAIAPKNSYGAVYWPWLKMRDPTGKARGTILTPPSGSVAGLIAKNDAQRGVWKAPAGTGLVLEGALGLAVDCSDAQQDELNPSNINVIRHLTGSGIVLWGARTITSNVEWQYIPIRRTASFLELSISRGIQWAVFEPNEEKLWSQLRLQIGSFMTTLFQAGAFQGSKPDQAFFIKCDRTTTTPVDINNGIVNVWVGFASVKPAEFVIFQISQRAGQAS